MDPSPRHFGAARTRRLLNACQANGAVDDLDHIEEHAPNRDMHDMTTQDLWAKGQKQTEPLARSVVCVRKSGNPNLRFANYIELLEKVTKSCRAKVTASFRQVPDFVEAQRHFFQDHSAMSSVFRAHRVLAVIVLIAAAVWVATGEFAAVGSEDAGAAMAQETAESPPIAATAPLRTVLAMTPVFIDHAREIRIAGATEADKITVLAARSDGIVEELGVVQGDDIAANALVLRLEGADVTAMVQTAEASLLQATEQLEVGENLFARGSLPELELTSRRSSKAAAEAALSQAMAGADRLLLNAPFAGIVDSVAVEMGEWVQAGAPIATILSLDPIVVKAEVSERDVAFVSVGSAAIVRLVNGLELAGQVQHVANQASAVTRTFVIEVVLPNPDRAIPSGMTAEVSLFADPQTAVVVPRSVITLSEAGLVGLRVVGPDNIAQFVPVTLIDDTGDGMIVTGVPEGVQIITAGQDLVRDGDAVIISTLDPAALAEIGQ